MLKTKISKTDAEFEPPARVLERRPLQWPMIYFRYRAQERQGSGSKRRRALYPLGLGEGQRPQRALKTASARRAPRSQSRSDAAVGCGSPDELVHGGADLIEI